MEFTETEDIWRLYTKQWVIAHTTDTVQDGPAALAAANAWAEANLAGRVLPDEIACEVRSDGAGSHWAHVWVFKDNQVGEFKHQRAAELHAEAEGFEEYVAVVRNSKSDHDIRSYGVRKL